MAADRRIVIVGAGVAGLETVLALRALALPNLDIHVVSPEESFLYRPVSVAEAFDRGEAREFDLAAILADQGATRHVDTLASVDAGTMTIRTGSGETLGYDELVLALGAPSEAVVTGALAFRGRGDVPALRALLAEMVDGSARRVAFALPSADTWPLPIYELALLAASFASTRELGTRIALVSCEEEPLGLFGSRASAAITELLRARDIALHLPALARRFEDGVIHLAGGGSLRADRLVALGRTRGPAIDGVPADREGFIPIDAFGRVRGVQSVYAAGDATAFPLKQGGLATQQADAIAEVIAQRCGADLKPRPFSPVIRGLLLTGGAPIYLRAGPGTVRPDTTVAGERRVSWPAGRGRFESRSSTTPLWWPPGKIAGRHLAPYLTAARPRSLRTTPLADRAQAPGAADSEASASDALEFALLLAEYDARWGDYEAALSALDSAQALSGSLPAPYASRRREWQRALAREAPA